MRKLLAAALLVALASFARADIHDPPANDHGPTRKLGRGISNLLYGWGEFPHELNRVNYREGNAAAYGYGFVRGIGRTVMRIGAGVGEILTFPFPTVRGTYLPVLDDETHWIHSGYGEFPPEISSESKYPYVRKYQGY